MSKIYCNYKNNTYKAKLINKKIRLTTTIKTEGFENYVDVLGNKHNDLFVKEILQEEADLLYKEDITLKYKEDYFQLYSGEVTKSSLIDNSFMIWTDSETIAQKYSFEKKEQFVFIKYITKQQIEAVKIVKQSIMCSQNEVKEEIIEGEELEKWFDKLYR